MPPMSVRHLTPAFRTYAGPTSLDGLARELDRARSERVVVICGRSIRRDDAVVERIESALGGRVVATFDQAQEHSPIPVVQEAASVLNKASADAVVALGGGSAVVTARAASILSAEGCDVRELCTRREADGRLVSPRLNAPKIAQWVVPSTPTTAYAKAGAAVRDPATGERLALFDPKVRATGVFFDPVVAQSAPTALIKSSALNVMALAVDGLQASAGDPLATASLMHALRIVRDDLPRVRDGVDPDVLLRLMFAALLAGEGSDHVGAGIAQGLAHAIGPRSTVGNGVVEAMLLPHTLAYNRGWTDPGLQTVASVLGERGRPTAAGAVALTADLLTSIGIPSRLRDVGVDHDTLEEVVAHAVDDWAITSAPRPAGRGDLQDLLDQAW